MTAIVFDTSLARDETKPTSLAPARHPIGPELRMVLARHDDRLLVDIGLTREDILGPVDAWHAERARLRGIWNL